VNLAEGLRVSLESLVANPLRSFLTLLGIVIGVAAIIAVVSVINGLNLYVEERMIRLGPTSFEVDRFGVIMNLKDFVRALRRNPPLRVADGLAVRERCGLLDVVAMKAYAPGEVRYGRNLVRSVDLKGITPEIMVVEPYDLQSGRFISDDDHARAAPVAFLGAEIAEEVFGALDPVGRGVKINGRTFEVIGVAAKRGSVFGMSRDNYALLPLSTLQKQYGSRETIHIVARAADAAVLEQAMDDVRAVLRARHHLRHDEVDDFGIVSPQGLSALWRTMSRTIFQVALFVVGISLVVGGIVIMNIMLVSVVERTREVGVRKAVGARRRDIRRQFLIESVVLACAGGVIGLAFAFAATAAIRSFSPLPASFPWWAPVLALSISSAVGVFFGLYPAAKAARLNPIDALRSE
jgi:putative ABC transport system permease protein